jgi:hypothetical protein
MLRPNYLFPDGQYFFVYGLGLAVATPTFEDFREVVHGVQGAWMLRPKYLFPDGQYMLVLGLGLTIATLVLADNREALPGISRL